MYIAAIEMNTRVECDFALDSVFAKEAEMRRRSIPPEMKIHGRTLPRRNANGDRLLTVASYFSPNPRSHKDTSLPMIRIRGRWLQQLGFGRGERIAVTVEADRLVLTLAREE